MDPFAGKYFSLEYLRRQILRQTDSELQEIDKQIEKEIESGKLMDPLSMILQLECRWKILMLWAKFRRRNWSKEEWIALQTMKRGEF